ncbi:MAG: DnaA/Hda family protein, partial [Anaerolinea sp.]|nr:DnaA/Hda family protein [Anaerolinea sp.]
TTQEEFFHTFNTLHAFNKQIVLASDRHPRELSTLEDRLRSRFEGGLVVDLQPPSLETRLAILRLWAGERALLLPRDVLLLLAEHARLNIRELEGVFNQIVAASVYSGQLITPELVRDLLDGFRRPRNAVTVQRVLETVARHFQVTPVDLIGPRRTERINHARQVAMYLSRSLTQASLPQIGEAFGGRKHSTVLHACNAVSELLTVDGELRATVEALHNQLVGRDPAG